MAEQARRSSKEVREMRYGAYVPVIRHVAATMPRSSFTNGR
jgi:hypothetical protein